MNEPMLSGQQAQRNRAARDSALAQAAAIDITPTSLVSYRSTGYLLIIGNASEALPIARTLSTRQLSCGVLATGTEAASQDSDIPLLFAETHTITLKGHLGEFSVSATTSRGEVDVARALDRNLSHFDLILDLQSSPLLDFEVLPFGYYAARGDEENLEQILAQLPEMTGEFEKARFFSYNADICAHGNSGLKGCNRCLNACPTGAITSLIDKIDIDPYYCQGGGSCATACPTGAIIYSYPQPADMINRLRTLLRHYREAGGSEAVLLFHDGENAAQWLQQQQPLASNILPVEVEEIGSVGMDTWLSALAFGAGRVILLDTPQVAQSVRRELDAQLGFARPVLTGMGYPEQAVLRFMTPDSTPTQSDGLPEDISGVCMPAIEPAGFAGSNEKRNTLFFAIDWLYRQAPAPTTQAELPAAAPFGEIRVDRNACTLCMACVSVCPAAALADGGDVPQLNFVEANCVQCGLCEIACPEDAITRAARFVYPREQRMQTRVLNEEAPFRCLSCGTAFATQSVIKKMLDKLSGHSMFQDEQALRRLQMCGDCRVKSMFEDDNKKILQ